MACAGSSRDSKIALGVAGGVWLVGGAIVLIVAYASGFQDVKVGFERMNETNVTLMAKAASSEGFTLHIKASDHDLCETALAATNFTLEATNVTVEATMEAANVTLEATDVTLEATNVTLKVLGACGEAQTEWEAKNEPPLRTLGRFFFAELNGSKVYGNYTVTSTLPLWVVDRAEELGQAVDGVFSVLHLCTGAVVLLSVSLVLCAVCADGNRNSKIAFGVAACVWLVGMWLVGGASLLIAAYVSVSEGTQGLESENKARVTLGEAGGIFTILSVGAVLLLVVYFILCYVGCCCMGKSVGNGEKPQQGTEVGQSGV